jgi:hypothetical protein
MERMNKSHEWIQKYIGAIRLFVKFVIFLLQPG